MLSLEGCQPESMPAMSKNPEPSAISRPAATNRGGRYLFMFLFGLVLGIVAVIMGLRALDARKTWQDHYPVASMQLLVAHNAQLAQLGQVHRCTAGDLGPHLLMLRYLGNELEPAFAALGTDHRFVEHASVFRKTLDAALANPPATCEELTLLQTEIDSACKACHRDFR